MRRSAYFGAALIGLLVVAAISVAAGSGRKPSMGGAANVNVRQLSGSEVMDILNKFPEMLPSCFAEQGNDTAFLKTLFPFNEVTSASLGRVFPGVRFYQGLDFGRTEGGYPYVIAIASGKRYMMPGRFNRLLVDNGQKVTDKNMVELAEAFVILAVGSEGSFPEITFLSATRTELKADLPTSDAAILKVKTGKETEEWHFSVLRGQFEGAARANAKGVIQNFPCAIVESLPGRGQLDLVPNMIIGTSPTSGDAYVEFDSSNLAHYYVIVKRNQDSTGKKVVFSLTGFPSESTNICVRVRDSIRHTTRWLDTVQMSSGSGSDTWQPRVESTGICLASAGYDVGGTYVRVTNNIGPKEGHFPIFLTAGSYCSSMSRIARVVAVGLPHHVTQRGNNRGQVFFDDDDRQFYLWTLAQYRRKYGVDVWGYCLMDNHMHVLAVPHETDSLARCFAGTNLVYTQHTNRKQGRSGRLWQNRFFSCPVDKDEYLWPVLRYIDRNPVRSKTVLRHGSISGPAPGTT